MPFLNLPSGVSSIVSAASPLRRAATDPGSVVPNGGVSAADMARSGATFTLPPGMTTADLPATEVDEIVVTGRRSAPNPDRRVRLKAIVGQEENIYGANDPANVMSILHSTGGMLFPFTPTIAMNQDIDYRSADLVHTNMELFSYNRTPSVNLSVTGKFAIQNQREGRYAVAVIHFLRTASKMAFGELDAEEGTAGLPPPILVFDAYGNYAFNNLQCVLKNHSYTFDDSVDYVDVALDEGRTITRLPSLFTISLTLAVTRSPESQRKDFSLTDFRSGALMRGRGGWI